MHYPVLVSALAGLIISSFIDTSVDVSVMSAGTDNKVQYRIMFYNVENLFDVTDDSITADEAFTPSGDLHWTVSRYKKKLANICKVIIATGGWQPPDIIGLCEVENRKVLGDLVNHTSLSKFSYRIIHKDSPDRRGIDAAMIVNEKTVRVIQHRCFPIKKRGLITRDILYVKAILGMDTCHFFVNHWPSRSAGQLNTERDRYAAALLLKHLTDSLLSVNSSARILIMGDFNDDPTDESMVNKLNARTNQENIVQSALYNLTSAPLSGAIKGTLKYQGEWNIFDQIIVSGSMLTNQKGLSVKDNGFGILRQNFLIEPDGTYNGYKPYRTYNGFTYKGGFSDHLPVYVDLILR